MLPRGTTDADGRFRITGVGRDRAVYLRVTGAGLQKTGFSVLTRDDVGGFTRAARAKYPGLRLFGPTATIEAPPGRTLAGVVKDAETGEPVAGMELTYCTYPPNGVYLIATTDGQGRYRICRPDDQASVVVFTRGGYTRYLPTMRRLDGANRAGEIVADLSLPRGVVVSGRVLEAETNRPIVSGPSAHSNDVGPDPIETGSVHYFPLGNNNALRAKGSYFSGFGEYNWDSSAQIASDGSFRMAVPPGPGVILAMSAPGFPAGAEAGMGGTWKASLGLQRLVPYLTLTARSKNDGAPPGDIHGLSGFNGPINVTSYHAYRVINPPADAKTLDLTLTVPRAPTRSLRFVQPGRSPNPGRDRTWAGGRPVGMAIGLRWPGSGGRRP